MRLPRFAFLAAVLLTTIAARDAEPPAWAYPVNPPSIAPAVPDDGRLRHVPDSPLAFTRGQITAIADQVVDWHPDEHPPMPGIVARSRAPKVYACAYCHLPNGAGRPENASLAGLTPAYFIAQVLAFRHGDRPGAVATRAPQTNMIALAHELTDAEVAEAANYFAALKPRSFVRVVETDTVPRTIVAGWTLTTAPEGGSEPLGQRIIEMPESFERFENRDPRTAYVAYVPVGSIARGGELAATGGGRTVVCSTCHGPELHGLADVPRLAGRSPSYLFRQLYDVRAGWRHDAAAEQMKPVVANLADADLIDLVAYVSSRSP